MSKTVTSPPCKMTEKFDWHFLKYKQNAVMTSLTSMEISSVISVKEKLGSVRLSPGVLFTLILF